jgi:hypothetical protein
MTLQYENNTFRELIERYSTWDELSKYLESEEGGLFRIVDKNDKGYCLIRYEKGVSKMSLPHSKWFRSVVWNTQLNRPICIAPPKACIYEFPYKTIKGIEDSGVICQEFLEGFMINCFRVVGDDTLYITSRSKLDATGKFYSEKTFRELFLEAFMNTKECPVYSETVVQFNSNDIQSPDSSKNEIAVFYSFLVQHKEHRIVKKNDSNRVFVVQTGIVYDDGRIQINDNPDNEININLKQNVFKGSYAQAVSDTQIGSEVTGVMQISEVQKSINKFLLTKDWQYQGVVFKDNNGNRWRFRSDKYNYVKGLRGNSSSIIDRYAQIFSQNLINEYLQYYTEDTMAMTVQFLYINYITGMLHDLYVDLHITKTKNINDIDKMLQPHMYRIHGIYLSQLRPNGKKVTPQDIVLYLHKQPWQRIAQLLKEYSKIVIN